MRGMAGSRTYRTCAIVLDKTKLKETDLILTLLARDGREIRAVAKGARKPGSRLAARCELFCTVDLLLAKGRSLDVVSQADLVGAPMGAAPTYEAMQRASVIAEVASLCCFEDATDPFVFSISAKALRVLGSLQGDCPHMDLLVAAYVFKLLSHVGYRPDLSSCVACGDPALAFFSASAGGLLCSSCASSVAGAEVVDAEAVNWLRALLPLTFDELVLQHVDTGTSNLLLALSHAWAATHLDARLRAMEFLLGR